MTKQITVAVDVMGGDNGPATIIAGAKAAANDSTTVLLVGDKEVIDQQFPSGLPENIDTLYTTETVGMAEEPVQAVRRKTDSSIVVGAKAVGAGRADAFIGAGNTGAMMAASIFGMGRVDGVVRPAIAVPIPLPDAHPRLLIDGGATVDCEPAWLAQWAVMGRAYAAIRLGVQEPTVGLLSNGEEPGKGDQLRKATYELLAGTPGFKGNVEGRDLMSDKVDVIVTDGMSGNIALKAMEGMIRLLTNMFMNIIGEAPVEVANYMSPRLIAVGSQFHPDNVGGATLLGVKGVTIISHGASSSRAIENAIGVAAQAVASDLVAKIEAAVSDVK